MAHHSFARRVALAIAATAMAGCSALQIDVDVYKGPLVNHLDVQIRQYAYLVEASKPLVARMFGDVVHRIRGDAQAPHPDDVGLPTDIAFLYAIRTSGASVRALDQRQNAAQAATDELMADAVSERARWLEGAKEAYPCPSTGHRDLLAICGYLQSLLGELHQVEHLTVQFRDGTGSASEAKVIRIFQGYGRLNEAVIHFATQVNFVTAQIKLYETERLDWVDKQADVLQALSNILLVHANDVQRQMAHADEQKAQAANELEALRAATNSGMSGFALCQSDEQLKDCKKNVKTQMGVLDMLIANLRAQRVQALAQGKTPEAGRYLDAINSAFEQRASMIYLRPAGDYLRSVHLASSLQDGPASQHRNMLNDWFRYTVGKKPGEDSQRKLELDKISWQNINRVTLGGGGATDFVVAKDDVGNWYVKAYSANPDAIIKSATSLALFNAGAGVNVNLLRRYQLQTRIDELPNTSENSENRKDLMSQRDDLVTQDGRPLLALQERFADRYAVGTRELAERLLAELDAVAPRMKSALGGAATCVTAVTKDLAALDAAELKQAREDLKTIKPQLAAKDLNLWESAIRRGLAALRRFSERASIELPQGKTATTCGADWAEDAAANARGAVQGNLARLARERLTQIERYDDALNSVLEVATQK